MTVPLIILAFLSIVGGWFAAPHLMGGTDYFERFLHPVFSAYAVQSAPEQAMSLAGSPGAEGGIARNPALELLHAVTGWPVIVAVLGLLLAWWFYIKSPETPKKLAASFAGPYKLL